METTAQGRGADRGSTLPDATDLIVQASFRGVGLGCATLRHRPRALRRDRYRIGPGAGAMPAPADRLEGGAFVLAEDTARGLRVNLLPAMRGSVSIGILPIPLATWQLHHGASFLLPAEASLHLQFGEMEYRIHRDAPPPPVRASLVELRWSEQRYTAGTALVFLLAMLLSTLVPPDARALSLQRLTRDFRLIPFMLVPLAEQERARQGSGRAVVPKFPRGAPVEAVRPNARGAEARRDLPALDLLIGDAQPAASPRAAGRRGPPSAVDGSARALARAAEIRGSGILGIFRTDIRSPSLAALFFRTSALGDGPDKLMNAGSADGYHIGGLEVRGTGAIGAGIGERTIGLGELGTIGAFDLSSHDHIASVGRLPARRQQALAVVAERPSVRGSLDREIIRRVVRRRINEIRYCYEQELVRAPALSGRLVVRFTIDASGAVAAALVDSSTLASPRVESCAVQAVRRWAFPQPQGGGIVIATYPFTFVPAGMTP